MISVQLMEIKGVVCRSFDWSLTMFVLLVILVVFVGLWARLTTFVLLVILVGLGVGVSQCLCVWYVE